MVEEPTKNEYKVSFGYNGGEKELVVQSNSTVKEKESLELVADLYKGEILENSRNLAARMIEDTDKQIPELIQEPTKKELYAFFNENGGEKELFVKTNSVVHIELMYPQSKEYTWIIVNEKEIHDSEVIELKYDNNSKYCIASDLMKCTESRTMRTLIILIKDASRLLPSLHLIYQNVEGKEIVGEAIVNLKSDEYNPNQKTIVTATFNCEEGGKQELEVKNDSYVHVKLTSNYTGDPRSWFLVNEIEIELFEGMELQESFYEENSDGSTQNYIFYIANAMQELPTLYFVYEGLYLFNEAFVTLVYAKRYEPVSESTSEIYGESTTTLKVMEEPTTIEEEPTTIEEEPTSIEEEPTTIEEEPTTMEEEPTAMEEEPTTMEEEPTIIVEEPTTIEEEPTTIEEEPTTIEEEPTTTEEEPTTIEEEPTTIEEEPTTIEEELTTIEEELTTIEEEPTTMGKNIIWG